MSPNMWSVVCALVLISQVLGSCPDKCRCPETEDDIVFEVHCNNVSLTDLPTGDLQEIFFIDMSLNNISTLKNDAFLERKWLNLGRVYLERNGLRTVEEHAFRGLTQLKILNLASNHITKLPEDIFATNAQLEVLSFNGNGNLELPENGFHLPHLDILSLKNCGLTHIPANFFRNMSQLHHLFLRGNRLSSFAPQLISPLTQLDQLDLRDNLFSSLQPDLLRVLPDRMMIHLNGNPLKCECHMFDSYALYQSRRFYEKLTCHQPTHLSLGEFFASRCPNSVESTSEPTTSSHAPDEGHIESTFNDTTTTAPDDAFPASLTTWNPWWIVSVILVVLIVIAVIVCVVFKRKRLSKGYTVHRTFSVMDEDEEQNFIT